METGLKDYLKKYRYMVAYEGSERNPLFLYGIECGPGWKPTIFQLLDVIAALDDEKRVRIFQIKEKFGTFRFYYNHPELKGDYGERIERQVRMFTDKINKICERCGETGHLDVGDTGYIHTICLECKEK